MAKLKVLNIDGKESGNVDLPDEQFSGHVNTGIIHQAVVMYRASLRQGTVSTKNRQEVSGGGRKPHKQKGTGRARAGSTRSPLWKGGGVAFGPRPRDFSFDVPKKVKKAAIKESLKAKYQSENLVCLEDITKKIEKTKEFAGILKNIGIPTGRVLAVLDGSDESIRRVSKNIPRFEMRRVQDVNAFDIMQNRNLLISKSALTSLLERIEK
jgi:large subunit ribosomal protein L4